MSFQRMAAWLTVCGWFWGCNLAPATNLIFNSSFELCTNPGVPDSWNLGFRGAARELWMPVHTLADWGAAAASAYHGRVSLQTSPDFYVHISRSIPLTDGPYVLSGYVKAEYPDSAVQFGPWINGQGLTNCFRIGTNWQRVVVSLQGDAKTKLGIGGRNMSAGKVWWDAIQLEAGRAVTPYSPVSPEDERQAVRRQGKGASVPVYCVGRAAAPPKLDGILDDICWSNQVWISFPSPRDGAKARTEALITYDNANVYFAVICHEPNMAKILAKCTNHDDLVYEDDCVDLFIDTQNYRLADIYRTDYQHFMMNALGARAEERIAPMWGGHLWSWNGGWDGAARREADRWTAEIAVPYSSLWPGKDFPETWGINICRSRSHTNEYIPWSGRYHAPETFPQAQGIRPSGPRFEAKAPWSFSLGNATGTLDIAYTVLQCGRDPVRARATLTIHTDNNRKGQVYEGDLREVGASQPSVWTFPVRYAPGTPALRFQVAVFDPTGRRLFLSPEEVLHVADLIDGPGPEYEIYLSRERQMNCRFDMTRAASVSGLELECVVRDMFQAEYGKTCAPLTGAELCLTIPLRRLPLGNLRLTACLMRDKVAVVERTMAFRRLPPPKEGAVVRTDRWRRVLRVDDQPFIGIGASAEARGILPAEAGPFLADLKKQNVNTLMLWEAGMGFRQLKQPDVVPDNLGPWLDAAQAYGMKVHVQVANLLQLKKEPYRELLDVVVAMVKRYASHPAVLSWEIADEPGQSESVPHWAAVHDLLREADPYHPVTLNINQGSFNLRRWNSVMDVVSVDTYPIPNYPAASVAIGFADMETILDGRAGRCWLQAYGGEENRWREPTPRELKSMTYIAAVFGCSQFLYFTYKPMAPDLYAMWGECAREMIALSGALAAPVRRHLAVLPETRTNTVCAAWRVGDDGTGIVIAINKGEEAQSVAIILPKGCRAGEFQVLFEKRVIKTDQGLLRDQFQGLERHVYRWVKP